MVERLTILPGVPNNLANGDKGAAGNSQMQKAAGSLRKLVKPVEVLVGTAILSATSSESSETATTRMRPDIINLVILIRRAGTLMRQWISSNVPKTRIEDGYEANRYTNARRVFRHVCRSSVRRPQFAGHSTRSEPFLANQCARAVFTMMF